MDVRFGPNKAECQRIDALGCGAREDSWESLGQQGDIQPLSPKGNQPWIFIGRTDAEAPILWPPAMKSWLFGKDPDAGKDWSQEEKGMTEGEMVGWHRWLNGHEFERAPEIGDGQGGLACCDSWGSKELDTTERLNWTELLHCRQILYPGKPILVGTSFEIPSWSSLRFVILIFSYFSFET